MYMYMYVCHTCMCERMEDMLYIRVYVYIAGFRGSGVSTLNLCPCCFITTNDSQSLSSLSLARHTHLYPRFPFLLIPASHRYGLIFKPYTPPAIPSMLFPSTTRKGWSHPETPETAWLDRV